MSIGRIVPLVSWIVVGLFIAVTALAAGRLLLLYRETREFPELLISILILGLGTLGVGGGFVIASTVSDEALRAVLSFVPIIGVNVGMSALCVFTWRVYRADSGVARAFCTSLVMTMFGLVAYAISQGDSVVLQARPLAFTSSGIYVSTMAWSAVEALLYWRTMKRRLSLGLADALLTNRFLLWGLATGIAAQGIAIGAIAQLAFGLLGPETPWVTMCYAAHGLLTAVFFWLAFQPPRSYANWIAGELEPS